MKYLFDLLFVVAGFFFGLGFGLGDPVSGKPAYEPLNGTYLTVVQTDQVALVLRFQEALESRKSEKEGGGAILPTYIVARMDLPRCFEATRKLGGETKIVPRTCPVIFEEYRAYVQ